MKNNRQKSIVILDFGSQYTQLIARRVREMCVYCEIHPFHVNHADLTHLDLCGVILSGGPSSVTEENSPRAPAWVFESGLPLFGICYGMQTMAVQWGGVVQASSVHEYGFAKLHIHREASLFQGMMLDDELDVWMSHCF